MKKVKLTKGKFALVDDKDYESITRTSWSYHHGGYAVRGKPQVSMHRLIMDAPKGVSIDHINGNRLDNRRSNLRFATQRQNLYNSLSNDGVHWRPDRRAWIVRMNLGGKKKYIGYFKDKKSALEARKNASIEYHGEFSPYA